MAQTEGARQCRLEGAFGVFVARSAVIANILPNRRNILISDIGRLGVGQSILSATWAAMIISGVPRSAESVKGFGCPPSRRGLSYCGRGIWEVN